MNPILFFKNLISANSGYSSKRFSALILLFSGISIPIIAMFIKPYGIIDDSILILSLQLLAAGCGLLGFTLKEARRPMKKTDMNSINIEEYDEHADIPIERTNKQKGTSKKDDYPDSNLG